MVSYKKLSFLEENLSKPLSFLVIALDNIIIVEYFFIFIIISKEAIITYMIKNKYSFISILSTDDYLAGLIVLFSSLKKTKSKYPFIVLLTSNISEKQYPR
jgi:hypothetical protein